MHKFHISGSAAPGLLLPRFSAEFEAVHQLLQLPVDIIYQPPTAGPHESLKGYLWFSFGIPENIFM